MHSVILNNSKVYHSSTTTPTAADNGSPSCTTRTVTAFQEVFPNTVYIGK
eukprot:m.40964 g.40964  ORF g.40964 m.40964 type:complete len:50 (+) comp14882_c0_seq3:395-544(+)